MGKHLFLFNVSFDMMLVVSVVWVIAQIRRIFDRSRIALMKRRRHGDKGRMHPPAYDLVPSESFKNKDIVDGTAGEPGHIYRLRGTAYER